MKKTRAILLSILLSVLLIFSACQKAADNLINQNVDIPDLSHVTISIPGSYGVMAAVKSINHENLNGIDVPVEARIASASFVAQPDSGTNVDAGSVSLNSHALTRQSNNTYLLEDLNNEVGLGTVTWVVSGSGSVPAINYTSGRVLPDYTGFSSLPSTVTRTAGLTIALGSAVTNADSVYVVISDPNGNSLVRQVPASASQCVFSASELSGLSTGTGILQVAPWNFEKKSFNSQPYFFILEIAYTKLNITIN
ncbi:MAG TPA: hypothetical protein VMC08_03825 [Bacteroidales bacterium]|nr:hypothetical protein [Bacteroidales bacterium]